jgi:CelD/BcsL family acetyltransferase involved in cellulose biosynthesis
MRVHVVRPQEMEAGHLAAWRRLLDADPALASPFLRPEFARHVAAVRTDVAVAIVTEGTEPVAFLGFQRRGRRAQPLAGGLSDCQAIVAAPTWRCDTPALLRAMGVVRLDVTRMLATRDHLAAWRTAAMEAPLIRLGSGFDAYAQERRAAGSNVVTQALSHARRLARELGPLRFVPHDPDPRSLQRLVAWKRAQYGRERWGGALDPFARDWVVALLERIHAAQEPGFAGMLSTLWAGDTLLAAHLGMRAHGLLHYWFPTYDPAQARLAPGRILLLEMIRHAAASGIVAIDLGAGEEGYKRRFANAAVPLAAGIAGSSPVALWQARAWRAASSVARHVPVGGGRRAAEWFFRRDWERQHA